MESVCSSKKSFARGLLFRGNRENGQSESERGEERKTENLIEKNWNNGERRERENAEKNKFFYIFFWHIFF